MRAEWDAFILAEKRLDGVPQFRPQPTALNEYRAFFPIVYADGRLTGFRLLMVAYPQRGRPSFSILVTGSAGPTLVRATVSFGPHLHNNVDGPPGWPRQVKGPRLFPYPANRDRIKPLGKEGLLLARAIDDAHAGWEDVFHLVCKESNISTAPGQPPAFPDPTDLFAT
jgi:hypothetical protein